MCLKVFFSQIFKGFADTKTGNAPDASSPGRNCATAVETEEFDSRKTRRKVNVRLLNHKINISKDEKKDSGFGVSISGLINTSLCLARLLPLTLLCFVFNICMYTASSWTYKNALS